MTERIRNTRLFALAAGAIAAGSIVGLGACSLEAEDGVIESQELVGEPEGVDTAESAITGSFAVGTVLMTTSNLNLRTGSETTYAIVCVIPNGSAVTLLQSAPANTNWYKVNFNGLTGWTSGAYLNVAATASAKRELAITRATAADGFSYWWGHGRYRPEGPGSSNAGSCSGGCPSCTHGGSYGGDCSGLIAKAWQVPSSNTDLSVDSHPYSTANFNVDSSQWTTVARGNMIRADAMVYNIDGAGHMFIFSSGDPWGSMYTHECKGCVDGCVYNLRTATSSYHAIRRVGY